MGIAFSSCCSTDEDSGVPGGPSSSPRRPFPFPSVEDVEPGTAAASVMLGDDAPGSADGVEGKGEEVARAKVVAGVVGTGAELHAVGDGSDESAEAAKVDAELKVVATQLPASQETPAAAQDAPAVAEETRAAVEEVAVDLAQAEPASASATDGVATKAPEPESESAATPTGASSAKPDAGKPKQSPARKAAGKLQTVFRAPFAKMKGSSSAKR